MPAQSMKSWLPTFSSFATLCVLLCVVSSVAGNNQAKNQVKFITIDIKPGAGLQKVQHSWDHFVCEFEYEAKLGNEEQWKIEIDRMKKGSEWVCRVEPSSDSTSVLFERFKMIITGAHVKKVTLESAPGVPLEFSEYTARKDSVSSTDEFKSKLTKVQAYCVNKHRLSTNEL